MSNATYIFGLHGKLAIAVITRWLQSRKPIVKVFKLVDEDAHDYYSEEVHSLKDYALFLGRTCSSRVVHVPEVRYGGVRENHIYDWHHHSQLTFSKYKKLKKDSYLMRSQHGNSINCWDDKKN
jgi:hypothetical protein